MLNKATIIGYLGKDPEVRYLPNGDPVANISIATTEKWKDKQTGEPKEATEWHRVNFFGRTAEIVAKYLVKGSLVYVEGKIKTRKYQAQDGTDRYATEIQGQELKMLGGRATGQGDSPGMQPHPASAKAKAPASTSAAGFEDMDDDIPF